MNLKIKFLLLFILIASFFVNGCASVKPRQESSSLKCSSLVNNYTAGVSVKHRRIKYTRLGNGQKVILLIASIHGNEKAGTPLLNKFCDYLKHNCNLLSGKTVIIVPIVNPDGFANDTRYNQNKIDLNRNFPADNRINSELNGSFPLSEPESWNLYRIVNKYKPARIITFHESLGCIDYDGPAEDLAKRLADKCRLPAKKLGARPGSLGSYVGLTLNTPIITVELTEEDSKKSAKQLWNDYKDMLLETIDY